MRLLFVLVVALGSAGVAGVWILSGSLRADQEEAAVQSLRADAQSLGRVQQLISNPDEDVLSEAREILDVIEGRPGVEQAALIDDAGHIRASGDRRKVGTQVRDAEAMRALAGTGAVTAQLEDGDFKYAIPVELGSRRYALVLR